MKPLKIFIIIFVMLAAFAETTSANRHRFHTTLTRIEYNAESKNIEISIQIFTHDLMALLEKRAGKQLDLDKSKEVDRLIADYINENFVLSDKNNAVKTLRWVGKEADSDAVRVYLETDSTESLEGFKLKNSLFFQSFPEQTNIVVCRYSGAKADLLYKVGDKIKEITANQTVPEK